MRNKRMANTQRKHSKGIIEAEHFQEEYAGATSCPHNDEGKRGDEEQGNNCAVDRDFASSSPQRQFEAPFGRDGLSDCRLHHKSNIMLRVKKSKNYNDSRLRYAVKQHVLHENISPATPSILRPHTHPHSRCLNKHHDASTF